MTAPTKPPLKRSFARDSWAWVPAVANKNAPTVTELNAASGINLSCRLFGDTQDGFSASTDRVTLPRMNCEADVVQVAGATTHSAPDFLVSHQPQAAAAADGRKAWDSMDDLSDGFLIRRQDGDPLAEFAENDWVDVVPASLGVKVPTKTANGAEGVYAFTVPASITDTPAYQVQVVDTP